MFRKFIIALSIGLASIVASAADGDLFKYPTPPESLQRLDERCNYLIEHFWDTCNMKAAFSSREKLRDCFSDWIGFMPYGTVDVIMPSIERLLKSVEKSGDQTLAIARWAQQMVYSDSADFVSDQLYLPFARAAAGHKKISSAERAPFQAQVRVLESSSLGSTVPPVQLIDADGNTTTLHDVLKCDNVILYFYDPDCFDCRMARTRLSIEPNLKQFVADGSVQVIAVYAGDPDDEWQADLQSFPQEWTVVASPDIDMYFNLPNTPRFYILDKSAKVTAKDVPFDNLMRAFAVMMQPTQQ